MAVEDAEEIYVLDRRVRLLQVSGGFRTSMDSVVLAAACPAKAGESVLDMGCGVGGAGFCVLARVPDVRLTGMDVQADHIDLARRNVALNDIDKGDADFICCDIRNYVADAPFDHVICNPPYLEAGAHTVSPDTRKALALGHQEDTISLADWVDAGFRAVRSGGSLTIIHRADMLDRILLALGRRFGAVEIVPLWPRAGQAAKRVVVRAVKDRRSPAVLHAGLVLHCENGSYTPEAEAILRDMKALTRSLCSA